jgi:CubicO group peptidase (beta-lactamase class C family)
MTARRAVVIAALVAVASAPARAAEKPDRRRLDAFVERAMAAGLAPGLSLAVVRGGETVHARGFGLADREAGRPATPETLFYLASTTKSFTALAAALLHQRGVLDLDAPLSRALPAARLHPSLSADAVTVRDLLTHTHGISNNGPVVFRTAFTGDFTEARLLELLAEHTPAGSGRAFAYGNLGYVVAGQVLARAAGTDWKGVVEREVLAPAGMKATSAWRSRLRHDRIAAPYAKTAAGFRRLPDAKRDANMHAAGGHFSTARDLARYLQAHLDGGRIGRRRVFPAAVLEETRRQQAGQDRRYHDIARFGWGLGWDLGRLDGELLVHRFGGFAGYHSHLSFMPERGLGVAVLVNESGAGGRLASLVAGFAYELWLGRPDLEARYAAKLEAVRAEEAKDAAGEDAARAARSRTTPRPLDAYAGAYESPAMGRIVLRVGGGGLEAAMGVLSGPVETAKPGDDSLRVDLSGSGFVVTPVFPPDGGPASGLRMLGAEFTRVPR